MLPRPIAATLVAVVLASSVREPAQRPVAPSPPAGFLDKVWMVTDSPAGKTMDRYVFLYDGTYVVASKDGAPRVGKWSWDGFKLTMMDDALPYQAEILSLSDSTFEIRIRHMGRNFDVAMIPATASMPDTTRDVEFDPSNASIIADGENPAWLFTVDNDAAMLRTARDGTLRFEGEWYAECAAVWTWEGRRVDESGEESIELTISTATCVDSASGAESPLDAYLDWRGHRLHGCAVAGKLHKRQRE
jgi:uncharacterized membrane protein